MSSELSDDVPAGNAPLPPPSPPSLPGIPNNTVSFTPTHLATDLMDVCPVEYKHVINGMTLERNKCPQHRQQYTTTPYIRLPQ